MSDQLEFAAVAGPGVFELGGRTFVVSPLTPADFTAVHAEFRRQCLAEAKDPLTLANERISAAEKAGTPFSPTVVNAMVTAAMSAAARKEGKSEPSDGEVAARLHTLDGCRAMVWLRLLKADPSVTREFVSKAIPDEQAKAAVLIRLAELDGLAKIDPKKVTASG